MPQLQLMGCPPCRPILSSAIALLCTSAIATEAMAQMPPPPIETINNVPSMVLKGQSIPLSNLATNLHAFPNHGASPLGSSPLSSPLGTMGMSHFGTTPTSLSPSPSTPNLNFANLGGDRLTFGTTTTSPTENFVQQLTQQGWQANTVEQSQHIRVSAPGSLLSLDIDPQALENAGPNATLAELLTSPGDKQGAERLADRQNNNTFTPNGVRPDIRYSASDASRASETAKVWQMQENRDAATSQIYRQNLGDRIPVTERSAADIRAMLTTIEAQTGHRSAIVYAIAQPDALELIVMTAEGEPLRQRVAGVTPQALNRQVRSLRRTIKRPHQPQAFLAPAQTLYNWLITPINPHLETLGIDNLLLSLDSGLRTIPLAALHNGESFLIEQYSFSQIPSVNLVDSTYQAAHESDVLAMGRSQFSDNDPLPAVPEELATIHQQFTQGKTLLNEGFTAKNLQQYSTQYDIIHLATHAYFNIRSPQQSYIQLWDSPLTFDDLRAINQERHQPIELLILSACETGIDHEQAELGFGGLAIQTGAKSAIASLWAVSDVGTLALMEQLYAALANPEITIKAEALRQAQLALIQGHPAQSTTAVTTLNHPYYWSAFTLIGSPW